MGGLAEFQEARYFRAAPVPCDVGVSVEAEYGRAWRCKSKQQHLFHMVDVRRFALKEEDWPRRNSHLVSTVAGGAAMLLIEHCLLSTT